MTNDQNKKYDLRERTAIFGEGIVSFAKKTPENNVTKPLIGQLVRAGTSVGANYCEADNASTKKEFIYRIGICRKESKETKYWLRIVIAAVRSLENDAQPLLKEAQELNLIFSSIIKSSMKK